MTLAARAQEHSQEASNANQSDLVTNVTSLSARQQLTPALASTFTPPRHLPNWQAALPQLSARSSTAAADRHRARYHPADDTENQWLGSSHTPQSEPSKGKPSQRRRPKPKRPQWQDVSIHLSALQASQADAASAPGHDDKPVGSVPSIEAPGVVHMSGVSPASPSPPKQHAWQALQHKTCASTQGLPALASAISSLQPHQALSAWHENLEQPQQRQSHDHRPNLYLDVPSAEQALQHAPQHVHAHPARYVLPSAEQVLTHAEHHAPPRCLPPLHHHQSALLEPPHQAAADSASTAVEAGPYSPRQSPAEDPRSVQQVPMQYMRHPYGSGSPGGLHKLHRLLRPISRPTPESGLLDPGDASMPSAAGFRQSVTLQGGFQHAPWASVQGPESSRLPAACVPPKPPRHLQPLAHSQTDADDNHWQQHHQQHQKQPEQSYHQFEPDIIILPISNWQHQEAGMKQDILSDLHASRPHDELNRREDSHTAADDVQDVNMRLQQVRSCLRHGRQEEEQPEVPSSSRKSPSGPQTARGRRAVGDGGFAGMRLSQVMPALPPLQPRRHTDTNLHLSQSERRSSDSGGMGPRNRRQEGLDAWQGQGLDEVLRPVQPLGPVQAGRQRMPPAPGSSAALRSTYAGYIQELQQSGASMGNRLALHAGRQQTGPGVTSAADVSHRHAGSSQQLQGRSSVQQPGPNIVSLLRRVTYTEKASQLQQADKIRDKSGGDAQTECSICLENFVMQEQLRRVGCGHLFHTRCIHEWFATGDTRCPMCRFDPVMKRWPG
ncbi:MAG: hypothetical protein FRX49_02092 [Trebouxia sp. A1-2]|nr:MAG: hypothetical protein FRX49_02092 [Trebouxia sp. A1-2]